MGEMTPTRLKRPVPCITEGCKGRVFFSLQSGCNKCIQRLTEEVWLLFGFKMTGTWQNDRFTRVVTTPAR